MAFFLTSSVKLMPVGYHTAKGLFVEGTASASSSANGAFGTIQLVRLPGANGNIGRADN